MLADGEGTAFKVALAAGVLTVVAVAISLLFELVAKLHKIGN